MLINHCKYDKFFIHGECFLTKCVFFEAVLPVYGSCYNSQIVVSTLGRFLNKWFTRSGGSMHLRNLSVYRTRFLIGRPGGYS